MEAHEREFRFGEISVEPSLCRLRSPRGTVKLEPKVMQVLLVLARRAPDLVAKESLFDEVWPGAFVTDEVLTNAIWELRRALGDSAREPQFIETLRGRGYRLLMPVCEVADRSDPDRLGRSSIGRRCGWLSLVVGALLIAPAPSSQLAELSSSLTQPSEAALVQPVRRARRPPIAGLLSSNDATAWAAFADAFPANLEGARGAGTAKTAALRAIELDAAEVSGHLALGRVVGLFEHDLAAAERVLRHAVELNPLSAAAHQRLASVLSLLGRPVEAVAVIETAAVLDPRSVTVAGNRVRLLSRAGRLAEAERIARSWLTVHPDSPAVRRALGIALLRASRLHEGLAELRAVERDSRRGELACALAQAGLAKPAFALLADLEARTSPPPYDIARAHAGLHDFPRALAWLQEAWRSGDPQLVHLGTDPCFDALRHEPRVQALSRWLIPQRAGDG